MITQITSTSYLVRVTRNVSGKANPWQDYTFSDLGKMWSFVETERKKPATRRIVVFAELQCFDVTH